MYVKIWSNEHNAWWEPNCMGYTQDRESAGVYNIKDAVDICTGANYCQSREEVPNETIYPIINKQQ